MSENKEYEFELNKRKIIVSHTSVSDKIHFTQLLDPNEFPKYRRIWVGHPAIAKFLAKILNKLSSWWRK